MDAEAYEMECGEMQRLWKWVGGVLAIVVALECVCRWGMGLGDPSLLVADEELDYRFVPDQQGVYQGCRYAYNNASMRSDRPITPLRQPTMRRVLVVGDSIVNGEARTDQDELATSLLAKTAQAEFYNLSACSWGPLNSLAYFQRYGTFDATDVVFLFSNHDLWDDDPRLAAGAKVGLSADFQAQKPWCATWEWVRFYLYPKVRTWLGHPLKAPPLAPQGDIVARNLAACSALYQLPIARKAVIFHRTQREWEQGGVPSGEQHLRQCAQAAGVPVYLLEVNPSQDYRDNIHLNASGQRQLAAFIQRILLESTSL